LTFPEATPSGSSHFRCRCWCTSQAHSSAITRSQLELLGCPAQVGLQSGTPPSASVSHSGIAVQETPRSKTITVSPTAPLLPIISIGPHTDLVLDRLRLKDSLIPQLHTLVTTVRSSSWEAKLRTAEHGGLDFEQASAMSKALQADIHTTKVLAPVREGLQCPCLHPLMKVATQHPRSIGDGFISLCVVFLLALIAYYLA
jgi:hypothetical protein